MTVGDGDEALVHDNFSSTSSPQKADVLSTALYNPFGQSTESWSMPSGGMTLQPVLPSIGGVHHDAPVRTSKKVTSDGIVLRDRPWMHPQSASKKKGRLGRLQELEQRTPGSEAVMGGFQSLKNAPKGKGEALPSVQHPPHVVSYRDTEDRPDEGKGISRLQRALNEVVGVLVSRKSSLEEAWGDLTLYIEKYLERDKVAELSVRTQQALRVITKQTAKYKQPCNPLTNATVATVDQIFVVALNAYPCMQDLIHEARGYLHSSLFLSGSSELVDLQHGGWKFEEYVAKASELWLEEVQELGERKNYFQACRMLTKTLADKESNIGNFSILKHKGEGSLELVVKYWKMHLAGVLFRAWRSVSRVNTAVRDFASVVEDLRREVSAANRAMEEAQKRERKTAMQAKITESALHAQIDTQISQLIAERQAKKQLQAELTEAQKKAAQLQDVTEDKYVEVAKLLEEYQSRFTGSAYEEQLRGEFSEFLGRETQVTTGLLLRWGDKMVSRSHSFSGERLHGLPDLQDLRPYFYVLSAMSPKHVTPSYLQQVMDVEDTRWRAGTLISKVKEMGMAPNVVADDLMSPSSPGFEKLLACMFVRFAGASPADVEFGPLEHDAAADTPQEAPLSPRRLVERHAHITMWSKLAGTVHKDVWRSVVTSVRHQHASRAAREPSCVLSSGVLEKLSADGEALKDVTALIEKNSARLKQVFSRFSRGDASISVAQLWEMIDMAVLVDAAFTKGHLEDVVAEVTGRLGSPRGSSDRSLSFDGWASILVAISMEKYKAAASVPDQFLRLLETHIFRVDVAAAEEAGFRSLVFSTKVQEVVAAHKPVLRRAFAAYQSACEGGAAEVPFNKFMAFLGDMKALDDVCTPQAVDETIKSSIDATADSTGLLYQEFVVALCGVAVFKYPAPFLTLASKVEKFIAAWVRPFAEALPALGP